MNENNILTQSVIDAAREVEGELRLPCAKAFELAQRHGVEVSVIGSICNRHNIKISKCQLGCF